MLLLSIYLQHLRGVKMNLNFKVEDDVIELLDNFSKKTNKTKKSIVNDAIRFYIANENYKQKMLDTLASSPEAISKLLEVMSLDK